jgi:sulfoquinovose isomerase
MVGPALLDDPAHREWLAGECRRLLTFAEGARHPQGGFAWLSADGAPELQRPVEAWITCRMTHVFALGSLLGHPGASELVDHGVQALRLHLRDGAYGGWFAEVSARDGDPRPAATDKRAYDHCFVVLAATSATVAAHPDAEALLADALEVLERHFWREDDGMLVDVWDRDWTCLEPYRGVNANMHAVEAMLAAADVTGDDRWRARALRITARVVHDIARRHRWRLPEHFDATWTELPDYNVDDPGHPFRPYGVTIGHLLEWSRLCVQLRAALAAQGHEPPAWLLADAAALFRTATDLGWSVDGSEGFVYTTDRQGRPVIRQRLHWVVAEAISSAAALAAATGDVFYGGWYATWWSYAQTHLVDLDNGSWRHELDMNNAPATTIWQGKPDIYHAVHATLVSRLPLTPSPAGALRDHVAARTGGSTTT